MSPLPAGYKVVPLSPRKEQLQKLFKGHPGALQVEPNGWVLPTAYEKYAKDISELEFEEGDVVVMTMPKSGTTWTQELVWTMLNNANFDHPMAPMPLNIRTPIVEVDALLDHIDNRGSMKIMFEQHFPDFDQSYGMFLHLVKTAPRPRTIKTHLSFDIISPTALTKAKVVYVIRDPRDVCISYHHHCRIFGYEQFVGTFDEFIDAFLEGAIWLSPYWPSVAEAWQRRENPNLHIIFYEQLKKNTTAEIRKLDKFLGTKITDEQLDKIEHYTSFDEMKKRDNHVVSAVDAPDFMDMAKVKTDGGFFRQGMSGGWKKVLNQDQKDKFDVWIKKHCPDKEIMKNILNP